MAPGMAEGGTRTIFVSGPCQVPLMLDFWLRLMLDVKPIGPDLANGSSPHTGDGLDLVVLAPDLDVVSSTKASTMSPLSVSD